MAHDTHQQIRDEFAGVLFEAPWFLLSVLVGSILLYWRGAFGRLADSAAVKAGKRLVGSLQVHIAPPTPHPPNSQVCSGSIARTTSFRCVLCAAGAFGNFPEKSQGDAFLLPGGDSERSPVAPYSMRSIL